MRIRLSTCTSILLAGLSAVLSSAGCGSDDDDNSHGSAQAGAAGSESAADDDDATGGKSVGDDDDDEATGGKEVSGSGGHGGSADGGAPSSEGGIGGETPDTAGQGGAESSQPAPSAGAAGQTSTAPVGDAILDDLIEAICGWEFKCCDAGERKYRLSPFIKNAADCKERFVYELRQSNDTDNPYAAGSAVGLLNTLGYVVDLTRVAVNVEGVQACIDQWEKAECATEDALTPALNCPGPVAVADDPCALVNLFSPKLELGDECTLALGQTAVGANDIECLPGSSCIQADTGDRPVCVRRGEQGDPCTSDEGCDFDFYCNDEGRCAAKGDVDDTCSYEDPDVPLPGEEHDPCKAGLTCNPLTKVCVESCSIDALCAMDSQCPEGTSCAPLTVHDDTTTFHVCRPLGHTSSARCDDEKDCGAEWYCEGSGVCAEDVELGDDCTEDAQCPEGTFCDDSTSLCTAYSNPGGVCMRNSTTFASERCGPNLMCIYDPDTGDTVCSSSKLDIQEECDADFDCKSGLCERADETAGLTCIAGAEQDDGCDDNVNTADVLRCAPGLSCAEGTCIAQKGPGESCEAEAGGAADPSLCANGNCREQWETFMCTDDAVPTTHGGTGLVCDGAEP